MFGRKKPDRPKRNQSGNLAKYGLFDIPQDFDPMGGTMEDSDGNDSDLEAELAALAGGSARSAPKKTPKKELKQPLSQKELDALVSGTLKEDPGEEEEVDENDPDLLSELQEIAGDDGEVEEVESTSPKEPSPDGNSSEVINVLTNRLKNYRLAEGDAKNAGETSKAKRFGRAIKTLTDLIKKANSGIAVDLSDETIPPEITVKPKQSPNQPEADSPGVAPETPLVPTRKAPVLPPRPAAPLPDVVQENVTEVKKDIDEELVNLLSGKQKEYKIAALQRKKAGDTDMALQFIKVAKIFDQVIEAVKKGEAVDLSDMPPAPEEFESMLKLQQNETQGQSNIETPAEVTEPQLISVGSMEDALQQRLDVYKKYELKAKEEDNSSKARRFGRIVKQYEQAIKAHKAGRPFAADELPTPPGFAPLPVPGSAAEGSSTAPKPDPTPKPSNDKESEDRPPKSSPSRISGNKASTSHQEKQVIILLAKQKQFKMAALNAKKQGELVQAKEFLKQAKGFDKLIEAAQAGLPVDWASIPVSPEAKSQLDNEYDIVMGEECNERDDGDLDVLSRLEIQLTKQLKMCLSTRDHHKALGDVAGTNRFERLALNVTKDLDIVRVAKRKGCGVPKFHYETKDFSIVKSFTDLTDNDLELTIVRGINYRTDYPKDIDTYVKFEFPFPQETPYTDKTGTVKNTNCPEYNHTFVLPIQRNSRQCQRVFKRHGIKFEVYSKGGFFRSDALIGTVNLKLQPLETHCEIHDSFDLMDGRKKTGGKLEVRLRLRSPIVTQQVEKIEEKWLVISQ